MGKIKQKMQNRKVMREGDPDAFHLRTNFIELGKKEKFGEKSLKAERERELQ